MPKIRYARLLLASAYTLLAVFILLDLILSLHRLFNDIVLWIVGLPWTLLLSAGGLFGTEPDEIGIIALVFAYLINAAMIWWWATGPPRHFRLPRR